MEKCGIFLKNGRFSGRIWPDWGNAARADMAGFGSIGLKGNEGRVPRFSEPYWPHNNLRRRLRIRLPKCVQ